MPFDVPSPLEQSREDALRILTRLIWWVVAPVSLLLLAATQVTGTAAFEAQWVTVLATPILIAGVVAVLLRPSPARSLVMRGWIAILMMAFLGGWGLFINGPRAANAAALAIVFSLGVLFLDESVAFWGIVVAMVAAGAAGFALRSLGILSSPPAYGGTFDFATAVLTTAGLAYCAHLLWVTLRNYRHGQAELLQRSRELLDSQAEAQRLQQQETVARLATVLAGDVAAQLDGIPDERVSHESRVRATHTLRLLESLGAQKPAMSGPSDLNAVLQRVATALRPLLVRGDDLEIMNVSSGRPQLEAGTLEQILVYLALQAGHGERGVSAIAIRAYDGLGDITRSDGGRTWTIIEITGADGPAMPAGEGAALATAPARIGSLLADLVVANAGGRLQVDHGDRGAVTFVVQLPSH